MLVWLGMDFKAEQPSKAPMPIAVKDFAETDTRAVQPLNPNSAKEAMAFKEAFFNEVEPLKQ